MSGSSRREENERSVDSPRCSARLVIPNRIVETPRASSIREVYSRGGQVVFAPTLIGEPSATPYYSTCLVEWTTDIPAYHRVKAKRITEPVGEWITGEWSGSPSTAAAVTVPDLAGEAIIYYYKIQSCSVGDGSQAFEWYPVADNEANFATTCTSAGSIVYSNMLAAKKGSGKFYYLRISWNTNFVCKSPEVDASWASGDGTGMGERTTSFYRDDYSFKFDDGSYNFKIRNRNMCYVQGAWSSPSTYFIVSGGNVYME